MDSILKKVEFSPVWTKLIFRFFGYLTIFGVLLGIFLISKYSTVVPMTRNFFLLSLTIGQFVIVALALQLIILNYRKEKRLGSIVLSIVYIYAAVIPVILSEYWKGTPLQFIPWSFTLPWGYIKTFLFKAFLIDDIYLNNIFDQVLVQFILIVFVLQLVNLQRQREKSRASAIVSAITVILGVSFVIFLFLFYPGIPVTGGEPNNQFQNLIVIITTISGLITAISALYGQILTGKKLHTEIELLRAQKQSSEGSTRINKKTARKNTKKTGKR